MIAWADIRREPFRLFFPLATIGGLFGVNHWLVYGIGWTTTYSGFFHAGVQIGTFMLGFILGFLLTAVPRFAAAPPTTSAELAVMAALFLAQPIFLSCGQWLAAEAVFAGLLVAVAVFAGRRFASRKSVTGPPAEFVWIFVAVLHGLLGSVLLILGQLGRLPNWALGMGRPMVQQGFLLAIVMGVGGFMAPRLMGRSASLVTPTGVSPEAAQRIRRRRMLLHAVAGAVLFLSFILEGAGAVLKAYQLRALVVTAELSWTTQWYRPPAVRDFYVRLVWVSLWMILCGFWGAGLLPNHRVALLHLAFLGGFSLMAFAVGTMVVLSHGGAGQQLRQPLWSLKAIGAGIIGAIIFRVAADWMPGWFFQSLAVAAVCWSVAGLSWLWIATPHLLQPVAPETFERLHEEAKRRLVRTAVPAPGRFRR